MTSSATPGIKALAVVSLVSVALILGLASQVARVRAEAGAADTSSAGDDRADAILVSELGSATVLNVHDYTSQAEDPLLPCLGTKGHQSVWLRYTATEYGLLVFDTDTDDTSYDTALAIWVGQPDGALQLVSCATGPSGAGRAMTDVAAQPGVTYLVEVVALQPGAVWLKVWLHACSALPLPPQAPGLCAYPGPEQRPEPAHVVSVPCSVEQ